MNNLHKPVMKASRIYMLLYWMDNTFPAYRDFSAVRHFHERGFDAVLSKMLRIQKDVPDGDLTPPPKLMAHYQQDFQQTIDKGRLSNTLSTALSQSQLPQNDQTRDATIEVFRNIVQKYGQAFYADRILIDSRNYFFPSNKQRFYVTSKTTKDLSEILKNHVSNYAEASFRTLGFDAKSAHALHGLAIGLSLRAYQYALENTTRFDYGESNVNPGFGSIRNKTDEQISDEISRLERYWIEKRDVLQNCYRTLPSR